MLKHQIIRVEAVNQWKEVEYLSGEEVGDLIKEAVADLLKVVEVKSTN
jgi:hypothetical protein